MINYPPIVLVGYRGSQKIVPSSKYLTDKYLPMFNKIYLNYEGGINGWGKYVAGFMRYLTDEFVIFALDDYLVSDSIDIEAFRKALADIEALSDVTVCKLCYCTEEENQEYPVTTQYSIWKREKLIQILEANFDPWRFEVDGSKNFRGGFIHRPCIPYFTNSSISSRWGGVRFDGLNQQDEFYIKNLIHATKQ
jgi:hypothetical protein